MKIKGIINSFLLSIIGTLVFFISIIGGMFFMPLLVTTFVAISMIALTPIAWLFGIKRTFEGQRVCEDTENQPINLTSSRKSHRILRERSSIDKPRQNPAFLEAKAK